MARVFRAETVGVLLRPAHLEEAHEARPAGRVMAAGFKAAEDRVIEARG